MAIDPPALAMICPSASGVQSSTSMRPLAGVCRSAMLEMTVCSSTKDEAVSLAAFASNSCFCFSNILRSDSWMSKFFRAWWMRSCSRSSKGLNMAALAGDLPVDGGHAIVMYRFSGCVQLSLS